MTSRVESICALTLLAVSCGGGHESRRPPHAIILVSIDTLRADRLNAYGYERRPTSPNLDRLAQDGILFENQIAASPWTIPSHMSLFTALSPTAHGVTHSFREGMDGLESGESDRLADSITTLAEVLAADGRATAAFTGGVTLDPRFGFGRGFQTYEADLYKMNGRKLEQMLGWIDARESQPFFLFWHTFEVHAPYLETTFLGDAVPRQRARALTSDLEKLRRRPGPKSTRGGMEALLEHDAFTQPVCEALYDGGVRSMDAWLGKLLDHLREGGLYDTALIIFTSDHGEQLGEHTEGLGWRRWFYNSHGRTLYDELVRVPLVVKLPGQRYAGTRVSAVTRSIDVMPTIIDLVSAPPPHQEVQGISLRPSWENRATGGAEFAVSESLSEAYEKKSLRTNRHKYILSMSAEWVAEHGRHQVPTDPVDAELYDLLVDPGEQHDLLASRPAEREVADALDAALRGYLTDQVGEAENTRIDDQARDALRALGYVQ